MTSPKTLVCLLVLAAVLMLTAFSWPIFENEIYLEHDISANFVPLRYFYAQCLEKGESFLWLPNLYMGFYLHGDGQNGMTHPLHWFLYKFLPFTQALDLEFIASYPFMFLGMILLLRRWKLPGPAIAFGALLYTFGGYSMNSWLWLVHIAVLAHTPWLLLAIDVAMRSKKPRNVAAACLAVVLLTASELLVGYPQMAYITGLVEGIYVLFLLPSSPRKTAILWLLTAKLLGLLCAAIQLLPTLDLLQQTARVDAGAAHRLGQSLHPYNLFSLVNPYLYHQRMYDGNGYQGLYGGITATLLAAWTAFRFPRLRVSKTLVICCATLILFGLLMALGRYGYLYRWVTALPIIDTFRGPPRFGAMFHVGWVLLAALAFTELSNLVKNREKAPWKELVPVIALGVLGALLAVFIVILRALPELPAYLQDLEGEFAPTRNPLTGALVALTGAGFLVAAARGWRYGLLALLLFTVADLSLHNLRHRTTGDLQEFIAAIEVPDTPPEHRLEPNWHPVYSVNGPLMKGYSMVTGHVSLEPHRKLDYLLDPVTLRLAGAGWIRSRVGTNDWLTEAHQKGIEWIPIQDPMPRARLVAKVEVSSDPAQDVYTVDFKTTALVEQALVLQEAKPGQVEVLEDRPGIIRVRTRAQTSQLLVLTEAYDDDWRATLDGTIPLPVQPLYGDLMGCVVGPGDHEILFRFDPRSYRQGKALTLAGLGLSLLYYLALRILARPLLK